MVVKNDKAASLTCKSDDSPVCKSSVDPSVGMASTDCPLDFRPVEKALDAAPLGVVCPYESFDAHGFHEAK
jgi:hypothetical protein